MEDLLADLLEFAAEATILIPSPWPSFRDLGDDIRAGGRRLKSWATRLRERTRTLLRH